MNQVGHRRRDAGLWDKYDHAKKEDDDWTPFYYYEDCNFNSMLEDQVQTT